MDSATTPRPLLGLLLGDRNGIGPEISARLLADPATAAAAVPVAIGDPAVLAAGQRIAGVALDLPVAAGPAEIAALADSGAMLLPRIARDCSTTPGTATAEAGGEVLDLLAFAAGLAADGVLDGVVFAPLNKQAMHLAGMGHEDEMQYLKTVLACEGEVGELNELEGLWTTRVTSHVAMKDVAGLVDESGILRATRLAHATLVDAGVARPRLGICALNPHAGDGGNFGREEIEVIAPAVASARAEGLDATGPLPCDTVFVRARAGDFDAVVTMYHDQGQIAMKLMGFGRGVTVLGGLPFPVATCGHGTAYDIVGRGVAGAEALQNAWAICARAATAPRHTAATA